MWLNSQRLFAIAFVLILFSMVVRQSEYFDPDLWWHLRTGQFIMETRAIPHQDVFSFTKQGAAWVTHEWLTEVAMFAVYRVGGWGLLVILFSMLTTGALWLAYLSCDEGVIASGVTTLAGCLAIFPVIGVRPQMISLLLASVFLSIVRRHMISNKSACLWLLAPFMILWVNLHGAFFIGPAIIALGGAGLILDDLTNHRDLRKTAGRLLPLGLAFAGCLAVIPLNPNGARLLSYPFETLTSGPMQVYIQEWASPDFHQLSFQPLAFLIIGVFTLVAISSKRPSSSEILFLVVSCYAGLRSARHMPFFILVAIPILARYASVLISGSRFCILRLKSTSEHLRTKLAFNLMLLVVLAAAGTKQLYGVVKYRPLEETQGLPVSAVEFMRSENVPGPIYNSFNWGGYLIWKLPEYPVFIDGRPDMYGDQFFDEAIKTYRGSKTWKATLDRFDVQTVLIEPDGPLAGQMRGDPAWHVTYEDPAAIIFTRAARLAHRTCSPRDNFKMEDASRNSYHGG